RRSRRNGSSGAHRVARRPRDQRILPNDTRPTRGNAARAPGVAAHRRSAEQLLMNRMWSHVAMMPRARMWSFPSGALVALALGAAPADAQTPVARRDSGRVYRVQVQRSGDTVYVRNLRVTRQQLQERLDSLQHEFEGLGLDAPDRVDLVRELRTIISSLG